MTTKTHCIRHYFVAGRCFYCPITKQAHKAIQKQKLRDRGTAQRGEREDMIEYYKINAFKSRNVYRRPSKNKRSGIASVNRMVELLPV